mgnify:CR=1 FL=1
MLGHDPVWFVLLSGFVFFAWGEIYSLFPSTCTDTVRREVRHHQCRPALHGKGHRGAAGAGGELHAAVFGHLGQRVHRRGRRQHSGLAAARSRCSSPGARSVVAKSQASTALIRSRDRLSEDKRASSSGMGAFLCARRASGIPECFWIASRRHPLLHGLRRARPARTSVLLPIYLDPVRNMSTPNRVDNWHYVYQT